MSLKKALLEVRRAVDEALRLLDGDDGIPPLSLPQSQPSVPVGCNHLWQSLATMGMDTSKARQKCTKCGIERQP